MMVAKMAGEEAAQKIATRILMKVTQKQAAKLISGIGWALLAWDAIALAGPAKRITIPCVCLIAAVRTAQHFKDGMASE